MEFHILKESMLHILVWHLSPSLSMSSLSISSVQAGNEVIIFWGGESSSLKLSGLAPGGILPPFLLHALLFVGPTVYFSYVSKMEDRACNYVVL